MAGKEEALQLETVFEDFEAYDPLAEKDEEWDDDDRAELHGYIGDPGELAPKVQLAPDSPKTPREKIDELFLNMVPFKRFFLAVMDFCLEPKSMDEIAVYVDGLQAQRKSVYSAASFCQMLADVEAIEKITADGEPYVEVEVEPEEVEDEDGNVYLRPAEPPAAYWRTTEDGRSVVEEDSPIETLKGIIAEHSRYESIFLQILRLCDAPGGSSITEIRDQVNSNPILADPPKTAQFFMDYLDRNGAIVWDKTWKITDIGKELLSLLAA